MDGWALNNKFRLILAAFGTGRETKKNKFQKKVDKLLNLYYNYFLGLWILDKSVFECYLFLKPGCVNEKNKHRP